MLRLQLLLLLLHNASVRIYFPIKQTFNVNLYLNIYAKSPFVHAFYRWPLTTVEK